jgi:hypothetical protein
LIGLDDVACPDINHSARPRRPARNKQVALVVDLETDRGRRGSKARADDRALTGTEAHRVDVTVRQ